MLYVFPATAPGTVPCPTCRKSTALAGGPGSLLCNYQLLDAAEAWALRATVASEDAPVTCDSCEEDSAVKHCAECANFLCEDCIRVHAKRKQTRDHQLTTLAEFRAALASGGAEAVGALARAKAQPEYCPHHPRPSELHELTLFCLTCDK